VRVTTRVEGLRALEAALKELPKATGKNVARRALIKAAKPFDERWRSIASGFQDTGALVESGGVTPAKLSRRQSKLHRKASPIEVQAGPGPDPAAVQNEFGNNHQEAQPFVRPAWDATKGDMPEAVGRELAVEIAKSAARLARRRARGG
jgi:HK97 gp10 family phage protein